MGLWSGVIGFHKGFEEEFMWCSTLDAVVSAKFGVRF